MYRRLRVNSLIIPQGYNCQTEEAEMNALKAYAKKYFIDITGAYTLNELKNKLNAITDTQAEPYSIVDIPEQPYSFKRFLPDLATKPTNTTPKIKKLRRFGKFPV